MSQQFDLGHISANTLEARNNHLRTVLQQQQLLTFEGIDQLERHAGKRLIELSDDDLKMHAPLLTGWRDAFQVSIEELFLTYSGRRTSNDFDQFRDAKYPDEPPRALSDAQFQERFGPPPWDLLNDILTLVGLEYRFEVPPDADELIYEATLIHDSNGQSIRTMDLSSGERTLLAIAMSLYSGSALGQSVQLPKVLLLDEADASLHPAMVKSLLTVASDIFVARHGVKVILTTHSPTTVALAPEESLYVMSRDKTPRIRKADGDEAVAALAIGLSTLSVRHQNRRQVFVESEYDEQYYQEMFRLLRSNLHPEISLEFIASGKGGKGDCSAVEHLVTNLRDRGNDSVWGIVDRDIRTDATRGIVFLSTRYSIENLILDPLILASFMLREQLLTAQAVSLPEMIYRIINSPRSTPKQ